MTGAEVRDPTAVGPYRLVQRLGEGGMGVVHLALDPAGRAVAVKLLRTHVAGDPEARLRLNREVETLRRVRHARVAEVLDADVAGQVPYLVTRFVPGKTLDQHVREHGPLTPEQVADLGRGLAAALQAIHAAGVVHRDIKPANVMLVDGSPVLIDFGIAHLADGSRITMTGLVMGTPGYLSPEVVDGTPVSWATDWWGWAATLAFAASGRPPFGNGPLEAVLDRVRRGAADLDGVEPELRQVLESALVSDPRHRAGPGHLLAGLAEATSTGRTGPNAAREAAASEPTLRQPPPSRTLRQPPPSRAERRSADPAPTLRSAEPAPTTRAAAPAATPAHTPSPAPTSGPARTPGPGQIPGLPPPPAGYVPPTPGALSPGAPAWGGQGAMMPYGGGAPGGYAPTPYPGAGLPPPPPGVSQPYPAPGQAVVPAYPGSAPVPGQGDPGRGAGGQVPEQRGGAWEPPAGGLGPVRPTGTLLGTLAALTGVGAVAPGGALVIAALLMAVARTVDRSATSLWRRRQAAGRRSGDVAYATFAMPWHLLQAVVVTVLALVLPVLVGVSVAFIVAAGVEQQGTVVAGTPTHPGALALASLATLLTAWWGPGSGSLRRGGRAMARTATRQPVVRIVVWVFLLLVVVSALIVLSKNQPPSLMFGITPS